MTFQELRERIEALIEEHRTIGCELKLNRLEVKTPRNDGRGFVEVEIVALPRSIDYQIVVEAVPAVPKYNGPTGHALYATATGPAIGRPEERVEVLDNLPRDFALTAAFKRAARIANTGPVGPVTVTLPKVAKGEPVALATPPKPTICDCGAKIAKTPHAGWCSAFTK